MGLVFQQFNLFPQYNVIENLTLAPKLRIKERKDLTKQEKLDEFEKINARALELLETVGLTEKAKSYPCEISGGQQQRVAIARALMLEPEILCFDEPTSALDPELTGEVLKVIKSLKSGDRTMVIVTHEMEFAKNVSDKVIFMADGVIEEMGTPEELFNNPQSPKLIAFLNKANEII
jgi:polar amino acid transport system ATP-binding protein